MRFHRDTENSQIKSVDISLEKSDDVELWTPTVCPVTGGYYSLWASLVVHWERTCLPMQETWVQSLSQEDLLKQETTHSRILAWEIPWTEEPGGL